VNLLDTSNCTYEQKIEIIAMILALSTLWRSPLLFCLAVIISHATGNVESKTLEMKGFGVIRYHFEDSPSDLPHRIVLMLAVGTDMNVADYDLISLQVIKANPALVVILLDHVPGLFVKFFPKRVADLVEATKKQLPNLVPTLDGNAPIIIGGHSAGGEAAIGAMSRLSFTPVGYFGLDPFPILGSSRNINVPSMVWGYSKTTCAVNVNAAAKAAYIIGDKSYRVLYQIQNSENSLTHCSFTDKGCQFCPCSGNVEVVRALVGQSVNLFVNAIFEGVFERSKFIIDSTAVAVKLLVNSEEPKGPSTGSVDAFTYVRDLIRSPFR